MNRILALLSIVGFFISSLNLRAQSTAFTYQGQLMNSGSPANGLFDLRFKLALDPLGSTNFGNPVLISAVSVSNGLFNTPVDFGTGVFTGSNYWLQIGVRPSGGSNYVDLIPLQAINPVPYAMYSVTAASLSGPLQIGSSALPTTNLAGIVLPANGGLGFANTNIVPLGAKYSTSTEPINNSYYLALEVDTNSQYAFTLPGGGYLNDIGIVYPVDTEAYSPSGTNGIFQPTSTPILLLGATAGSLVGIQIYAISSNQYGSYIGTFTGGGEFSGTIDPGATIAGNPVYSIQYRTQPLSVYGGGSFYHTLWSSNNYDGGGNGSTLYLNHMGSHGYADINFATAPYSPEHFLDESFYSLQVAFGVTDPSFPDSFYDGAYMELYSASAHFNWVHAGYGGRNPSGQGHIGGVINRGGGLDTNFVFYWSLDGSTNNTMVTFDPGSQSISNNVQAFFKSNVFYASQPSGPTASQIGANNCSIWCSNGIIYASTTKDGTNVTVKQIAP